MIDDDNDKAASYLWLAFEKVSSPLPSHGKWRNILKNANLIVVKKTDNGEQWTRTPLGDKMVKESMSGRNAIFHSEKIAEYLRYHRTRIHNHVYWELEE